VKLAVFHKTARETALLLAILTAALVGFELLFVLAMGEFAEEITGIWKVGFIRRFIQVLVGADLFADLTPTTIMTVGLAHPLLYAFTWTLLLTTCTRVIAGEVDRGTADLLLTLPISRVATYASVSAVWALAGVVVSFAPLLGVWLGESLYPLSEPIELRRLWIPVINLFALYLAIGGAATLVSSAVSRRGQAVAIILAGLLGSFLLNILAQFWSPAKEISFLGLLHYYRPLVSVRAGEWPLGDIAVLVGIAGCCWLAGLWWFSRRDIPAA